MKEVDLYTDGACRGNPGKGGWGAILVYRGIERELSGGEPLTTNNRMELTGVIRGLSVLKEPCAVTLCTDSRYVADGLRLGWAEKWERGGWKKAGKPVKNPDLWQTLLDLTRRHEVTVRWVRGHNGHPYNERCDRLATAAADAQPDAPAVAQSDSATG